MAPSARKGISQPKVKDGQDDVPRISDHLAATRAQQFVGRGEEQALFARAIESVTLPFYVLHVSGPGGVGKTALLRIFTSLCDQKAVRTFYLDARNIEPTPQGFTDGLRTALGISHPEDPLPFFAEPGNLRRRVLFVDTYETLEALDSWIREVFLPQVSDNTLVVLAGRQPLSPAWRSDAAWQNLLRSVFLRNLSSDESRTYLSNRAVPLKEQATVLRFTHGYPLALSLVADVFTQSGNTGGAVLPQEREKTGSPGAEITPDTVEALLERFITHVPSPKHRTALEVCALVRVTDEALLTQMLTALSDSGGSGGNGIGSTTGAHGSLSVDVDGQALFRWLCGLSFIEKGKQGVFPHDIVRDVLLTDLRWRNKDRYAELHRAAREFYAKHLPQAQGAEQQRLLYDCVFLHRDSAIIQSAFTWQESGSIFPDMLQDADIPYLVGMVARHEGEEASHIAREWFLRQPEATVVFRDRGEGEKENAESRASAPLEPVGFLTMLALENVDAADCGADPAIDAAFDYLASSATPLRPGEGVRYLRFWMARDTYQDISPIQSLVIVQAFRHFLASGVRVAYTFFTCRDPEFWEPVLEYADIERIENADFCLSGDMGEAANRIAADRNPVERRNNFGVFGHDWRRMPTTEWLDRLVMRASGGTVAGPQEKTSRRSATVILLNQKDFADAVRDALRHYADPASLVSNPLLQSHLVVSVSGADATLETRVAVLRELVLELAETLRSSPRRSRGYRALYHTYLEPALTQEQAAERLDLPISTFRRHLVEGIQALQQLLWRKETSG